MKYLIAFDTLCQGWQTGSGDDGQPVWYDSLREALVEIIEDNLSYFGNNEPEDEDEYWPDQSLIDEANDLIKSGTEQQLTQFLYDNLEFNYYDLFVVPEDEWIEGRKVFFNI